jgi:hypothetical protein
MTIVMDMIETTNAKTDSTIGSDPFFIVELRFEDRESKLFNKPLNSSILLSFS